MKKEPVEFIFIIDKNAAMRGQEDIVVSGFNAMLREQQDMEEGGAHGNHYHERVPAGKDVIAEYRDVKWERKLDEVSGIGRALVPHNPREMRLDPWMHFREKGARIVEEVSVLRRSGNWADTDCWQNICWSERIDYIGTVKWGDTVPDRQATLFERQWFLGDSHTNESWYKITPDGKTEEYHIGDVYGGDDSKIWEM